jgi:hypothetical protein
MYTLNQDQFIYKNLQLNYCINQHNTRGSLTERVVEIPLLQYFLKQYPETVEIGCVSPYYQKVNHKIYDLTDTHQSCCIKNAKNLDIVGKNIVSISTIEHFDVDNYNISIEERTSSMNYILKVIKEASNYLITIPIGYNMPLTTSLMKYGKDHSDIVGFLTRRGSRWEQQNIDQIQKDDFEYNTSIWYANAIIIIENIL